MCFGGFGLNEISHCGLGVGAVTFQDSEGRY